MSAMVANEGKRYCIGCEKLHPAVQFERTVEGDPKRSCKLHDTGKEVTVMVEQLPRLCKKCGATKPTAHFRTYRYGGNTRRKEICEQCEGKGTAAIATRPSAEIAPVAPAHLATNGTYTRLHREQRGRCAICGQPETALDEIGQALPLSLYGAAHYTHRVQGLVCKLCNLGLSMFRDSPALLAAAIAFLTRKGPTAEGDVRMVKHN